MQETRWNQIAKVEWHGKEHVFWEQCLRGYNLWLKYKRTFREKPQKKLLRNRHDINWRNYEKERRWKSPKRQINEIALNEKIYAVPLNEMLID